MNAMYYDPNDGQQRVVHCEDQVDAAIITLLDRIASVLERWVDNRQ